MVTIDTVAIDILAINILAIAAVLIDALTIDTVDWHNVNIATTSIDTVNWPLSIAIVICHSQLTSITNMYLVWNQLTNIKLWQVIKICVDYVWTHDFLCNCATQNLIPLTKQNVFDLMKTATHNFKLDTIWFLPLACKNNRSTLLQVFS